MVKKRKSDVVINGGEYDELSELVVDALVAPASKKIRMVSDTGPSEGNLKDVKPYNSWQDVILEGEDDACPGEVPVYDDCNDVRRKIRTLMKTPGWKVTHWLRDIGNINNNSYRRFMKDSGPSFGATNGTYLAAYIYFEKVRIFEGKKKSTKRLRMEEEYPDGLPLQDPRKMAWVLVAA